MDPRPIPRTEQALRVVLVEDNPILLDEMLLWIEQAGLDVRGATDGRALDALLARQPCDVLVLDWMLPGEDGLSIARRIRQRDDIGIVMLTARGATEDRIRGIEDGADVYLVKPVDPRELLACIHGVHRRVRGARPPESGWRLERLRRTLHAPDGRQLMLTPQDTEALACLAAATGEVLDRDRLSTALGFGFLDDPEPRLNTLLSRLRKRLADFDPELRIQTWRGRGYAYVGPCISLG